MSSPAELVLASRLFDPDWYAAQCGQKFGSREEAVAHWVAQADPEASPHPMFEPLWLYPRGRWRRSAPDPLSFFLSDPDERVRAPHPSYDPALGPIEDWLAHGSPTDLRPAVLERAPAADVGIMVRVAGVPRAVAWMRHLAQNCPDATGWFVGGGRAANRILESVAAALPSVRVGSPPASPPVSVTVQASMNPPRWEWLPALLATLERPEVSAVQPLLLQPDFTVAAAGASYTSDGVAPLLAGHPAADAVRLVGLPLPAPWPGVLAVRTGATGATVLAPQSRLVQSRPEAPPTATPEGAVARTDALWRAAGFDGAGGRPTNVREGRPALRWAIDIAAPPWGVRWGDTHFAASLASALERLGQWVALDHPQTRERASRELDDVVLTIRGLDRVVPRPGTTNLLWVISHPELVTAPECAAYDAVLAASTAWAAHRSRDWGLRIDPLLQCTDASRFHPGLAPPDPGPRILFVGNSRKVLRPAVAAALATDTPVTVYGAGWDAWLPTPEVQLAGDSVANDELGALYAAAGLVLNDHWDDMRDEGFVSNRVFDVLACGARLLSDDVAGIRDVLGDAVPTWRTTEDFRRLTSEPFDASYPDPETRRATAGHVVAEHSFDARARQLLDLALHLRADS